MNIYTDEFWDAQAAKLTDTSQILKLPWESINQDQPFSGTIYRSNVARRNTDFIKARNIQKQTSGGKELYRLLKNQKQSRINILYYLIISGSTSGKVILISDISSFIREKKNYPETYRAIEKNEVLPRIPQKGQLMLIGVRLESIRDMARSMNHEEVAHAKYKLIDGKGIPNKEAHYIYYGEYKFISPDDEKVMTLPKYANTLAKKQYEEIEILINQIE